MNHPRIIGLCGDIGSGKDSVADFLAERHGYEPMSFAAKVKSVAADVYGLDRRDVDGNQEDKARLIPHVIDGAGEPRSGRDVLEILAEAFRDVDQAVWVNYIMRRIDSQDPRQPFVLSDVRYRNEFEAIRARGGLVWEVVKVGGPATERREHRSDNEWRSIPRDNLLVAQYGDLPGLFRSVELALAEGTVHPELRELRG